MSTAFKPQLTGDRLSGFGYDANGNLTTMPGVTGLAYDLENRLPTASGETYSTVPTKSGCGWKANGVEYFFFYGIGGRRMGVYRRHDFSLPATGSGLSLERDEVYFAGKRIKSGPQAVAEDRLGSTRKDGVASKFYPYGEEFGASPTAQDRTKFATYYRDSGTELDYADQRYYDRLSGRFLTADPYQHGGPLSSPHAWNRYAYAIGDPITLVDPLGLDACTYQFRNSGNSGGQGGGRGRWSW